MDCLQAALTLLAPATIISKIVYDSYHGSVPLRPLTDFDVRPYIFKTSLDLTQDENVWSCFLGLLAMALYSSCLVPTIAQRYLAAKTLRDAQSDDGTASTPTANSKLAIIEYLEEKYPEPRLLPDDIILRAKVRAIAHLIASGIQPLQNVSVTRRLEVGKNLDWCTHFITKGFQALEAVLSKTAGKYCVGDSVTMADICLVPQVLGAAKNRIDMTPYPTIVRINCALMELPAFKSVHPRHRRKKEKSDQATLRKDATGCAGKTALEAVLSKTAGKYCVGNNVTMADICLVPQVLGAAKNRIDMTPYPTIVRINCALMELPAFKVAHPSRQPNAPDNYAKFTDLEKIAK
ncbi:putative glutathione S-transferase [Ixodes scapularis]